MSKKTSTKKDSKPQDGKDILVNVILDRSGSMSSNRDGTISGYNEFLNGIRADKDTNYSVSLTQFDMPGATAELTVSYLDKPLAEVSDLTAADYVPRGSTPLYDAIGETMRRVEDKVRGRMVMTVIITDGQENASVEFNQSQIKQLITNKEAQGWKFVFLGAGIDSYAVSAAIGAQAGSTANFVNNPIMARAAFSGVAKAARGYSMSLRAGNYNATADVFGAHVRSSMGDTPDTSGLPVSVGLPSSGGTAKRFPRKPTPPVASPISKQKRQWATTDNK